MHESQIAPYGSWRSPITADLIVGETIGLSSVVLDGDDVYWTESRPAEGGRTVVVRRRPDGEIGDMTPPPVNVRSRVHEYGGGAFTVHDGIVYYVNFGDQHLYRRNPDGSVQRLSGTDGMRYADLRVDGPRHRLLAVREDHTVAGREPVATLVGLGIDGGDERVLVGGHDFFSSPRLSPDGTRLAWLAWDHPDMPWDGTELWVGDLQADGSVGNSRRVAGGKDESIFQPEWSPDGVLYFVSDRTGWWNLYRLRDGEAEALCPRDAEFGLPQWVFGMSTYGFSGPETIVCAYDEDGIWYLAAIDTQSRTLSRLDLPYTSYDSVQAGPGQVVSLVSSPTELRGVMQLTLASGEHTILKRAGSVDIDQGYLSIPRAIEFPTTGRLSARAFYYPPRNRDFRAPPDERPPLLVKSHGGPTGAADPTLDLEIQFWTSRGFAVLDVNYGGSTGYGRAYRQRLNGQWGIVDVEDCVNGARYLVEQGLVDGNRLAIDGGSAGGYTTLCAITFRDVFKAAASYYGVSDAETLAQDTHKFESRYSDTLIGPYPAQRERYRERSPIHFADRLSCPLILFQGLEDKVVPPDQSELMFEAARAKGLPVAYLTFAGEQHGFRQAATIKRSLEAELYFYGRVFGFTPADNIEPVHIENL